MMLARAMVTRAIVVTRVILTMVARAVIVTRALVARW